jgi:hypothetical protein
MRVPFFKSASVRDFGLPPRRPRRRAALSPYTQSGGDLPTQQFATESMFRDELSGTSYTIMDLGRPGTELTPRSRQPVGEMWRD